MPYLKATLAQLGRASHRRPPTPYRREKIGLFVGCPTTTYQSAKGWLTCRLTHWLLAVFVCAAPTIAAGQSSAPQGAESPVLGLWQAVDDHSQRTTALIRLEWHGQAGQRQLLGRVEKVCKLSPDAPAVLCQNCQGDKQNKPVEGMDILWGLTPSNLEMTVFAGGTVFDPSNGKSYRCTVRLRSDGQLEVRGFIGLPVLGRTQVWRRAPGSAGPATGPGPKVNAPGTPLVP